MIQNKCAFCSRNDIPLVLFGSGRTCSDCLATANRLTNTEGLLPKNKLEEAVLSLIFFLEKDLILTRQALSSQSVDKGLQTIVERKRKMITRIDVDYTNVSDDYINKIKSLIDEHSVLLDLYIY